MLFKKQICPHCGQEYDSASKYCTCCNQDNTELAKHAVGNGYAAISFVHQLCCTLLGTMFLAILFLFCNIVLSSFLAPNSFELNSFSQFAAYILLFITFIPFFVVNIKVFLPHIKKWQNYITGILLGIILIVFTEVYSRLIGLLPIEFGINENEQISRSIIQSYPITSILILGLIGPFCEEMTYRVGLFSFTNRINRILAYFVSIVVFALAHFSVSGDPLIELLNLPCYLAAGAIFTFAYDRFGLGASYAAHVINNIYAILFEIIIMNI